MDPPFQGGVRSKNMVGGSHIGAGDYGRSSGHHGKQMGYQYTGRGQLQGTKPVSVPGFFGSAALVIKLLTEEAMDSFRKIDNADLIRFYHAKKHGIPPGWKNKKPCRWLRRILAVMFGSAILMAIFL